MTTTADQTLEHETLFRTEEIMARRAKAHVAVFGLGSLGSNLVCLLAKNGFRTITGFDMDRVDSHNPGNQAFTVQDVGKKKTQALRGKLYRDQGVRVNVIDGDITKMPAVKLTRFDVLVDALDNWEARAYVSQAALVSSVSPDVQGKLVHVGLSGQGYAEVRWDKTYSVPEKPVEDIDACEYPMACNLVYMAVSVAAEVLCRFVDEGQRRNASITLMDLSVEAYPV